MFAKNGRNINKIFAKKMYKTMTVLFLVLLFSIMSGQSLPFWKLNQGNNFSILLKDITQQMEASNLLQITHESKMLSNLVL